MKFGGTDGASEDVRQFLEFGLRMDARTWALQLTGTSKNGGDALCSALLEPADNAMLAPLRVQTLARLASDELTLGAAKWAVQELLADLWSKAGIQAQLDDLVAKAAQDARQLEGLATFVCACCLYVAEGGREDPGIERLANKIQGAAEQLPTPNQVIADLLARLQLPFRSGFGEPRHDNDRQDFRRIHIVPTLPELQCAERPYLPPLGAADAPVDTEQHLEWAFRLLRADTIEPFKQLLNLSSPQQETAEAAAAGAPPTAAPRSKALNERYSHARFTTVDTTMRGAWFIVQAKLPAQLRYLETKSATQIKEFWQNTRRLKKGALVLFMEDQTPKCLGVIMDRSKIHESKDSITVGVWFDRKTDQRWALSAMVVRPERLHMLEASSTLFSHRPTLQRLQLLRHLPFADQLVHGQPPILDTTQWPIEDFAPQLALLNQSQRQAVEHALAHNVALIQGPPGTGKTHVGTLLARILLQRSERLLIVCQTNHALDQFLAHLLDAGIDNLVRIGGRSKHERLEPYVLHKRAKEKAKFSPTERRLYSELKAQLEGDGPVLNKRINNLLEDLQQPHRQLWRAVEGFLLQHHPDAAAALTLPEALVGESVVVGGKPQMLKDSFLYDIWLKGQPLPGALQLPSAVVQHPLWALSKQQRREQVRAWNAECQLPEQDDVRKLLQRYSQSVKQLEELYSLSDLKLLQECQVIGCLSRVHPVVFSAMKCY